jgi:hypothetical protein
MTLQTSVVFFLLAVAFVYTSIRMISALKQNFNEFYSEYRSLLLTATLLLTVPLCLRCMVQITKGLMRHEFRNPNAFWSIYNVVYFLTSTYLPILF